MAELTLFRQRKVFLAALAIIFVPSLYVLIYVSSVWDPYGNVRQLPVALVNQDAPFTRAGRSINLGTEVVATLTAQRSFAFVPFATPEAARAAVRAGDVYFALIIPADFSRTALGGGPPAQLGIYVSEGANYTASIFSRRFGGELAHVVNEKMNRERWAALVGATGDADETTLRNGLRKLQAGGRQLADGAGRIRSGGRRLHDGLIRAQEGAEKLSLGVEQVGGAAVRLAEGMKQVEEAVTTMRAQLPADSKLLELARGSQALVQGATELDHGLKLLDAGGARLDAGAGELQAGAAQVPFFGGRLSTGAGQLRDGIRALDAGLTRAASGATQLSEGLNRLDPAIQPLTAGLIRLNAGLMTLGEKLPPLAQLELFDRSLHQLGTGSVTLSAGLTELTTGSGRLDEGVEKLAGGANRLAAGLDEAVLRFEAGLDGASAAKLGGPVEVRVETTAPVANNGQAFAPYFSALSLWVGAVMMSFVFYLRRLPDSVQPASRPVKWFAKSAGLLGLVLGIPLAHPGLVWLVAVVGSLAFVSLVVLLMSVLGDAGRLLAVILLILQLASSGGIYPVELSSTFYQKVHGYLPFTSLVRAFRATMFAAFDGRWAPAAGHLALVAAGAMVLTVLFARWRYVPRDRYGAAVEF